MGVNDFINIGENIKKIRISKGISQKKMAELIGVKRTTYSNYENSIREPNTDVINKISEVLGVSVNDLLSPVDVLNAVADSMTNLINHVSNMQKVITEIGGLSLEDELSVRASAAFRELLIYLSFEDAIGIPEDTINTIINSAEFKFMIECLLSKFIKEGE